MLELARLSSITKSDFLTFAISGVTPAVDSRSIQTLVIQRSRYLSNKQSRRGSNLLKGAGHITPVTDPNTCDGSEHL